MKIVFVIGSLASGGAERVACLLCSEWTRLGHQVEIVTFEADCAQSHYALSSEIKIHRLDMMGETQGAWSFVKNSISKVRRLRTVFQERQPDVIISFMTDMNVLAILATRFSQIPVIVSERIHPAFHPIGRIKGLLRKIFYPQAALLIVQTTSIAQWFQQHIPGCAIEVIANPINLSVFDAHKASSSERKKLVAVARLDYQKGFDQLIPIFARLAPKHPDWDLIIFGEGPMRNSLEALIANLHMGKRIFLPGITKEIHKEMKEADLIVHPARYEGFPNVILEALAAGCAVVATDKSGGANDLICDNKFGRFTDYDNLENELDEMMKNPDLRLAYQVKARDSVKQYETEPIAKKWITCIKPVSRT